MRDPAYRLTVFAMLAVLAMSVGGGALFALGAPAWVILAIPLLSGSIVGVLFAVLLARTKAVADLPGDAGPGEGVARFDERVTSVLTHELPMTFQALRVTVTDAELIVAWDGRLSQKLVSAAPPTLGASSPGLGFKVGLQSISKAKRRRMWLPQFLCELLQPTQGLGMLGEWKYRVRGVRTGVSIQTSQGLRAWVATRRPDELLAAVEFAGRRRRYR